MSRQLTLNPIIRRLLNALAAICLVIGLWLTFAQPWIIAATAPTQPVHSIVQLILPDRDLLIVVLPASVGTAGRLVFWEARHDAVRIHELISIPGTPALPLEPPPRSAPAAEPAAPIPLVPLPQEPQIRL